MSRQETIGKTQLNKKKHWKKEKRKHHVSVFSQKRITRKHCINIMRQYRPRPRPYSACLREFTLDPDSVPPLDFGQTLPSFGLDLTLFPPWTWLIPTPWIWPNPSPSLEPELTPCLRPDPPIDLATLDLTRSSRDETDRQTQLKTLPSLTFSDITWPNTLGLGPDLTWPTLDLGPGLLLSYPPPSSHLARSLPFLGPDPISPVNR